MSVCKSLPGLLDDRCTNSEIQPSRNYSSALSVLANIDRIRLVSRNATVAGDTRNPSVAGILSPKIASHRVADDWQPLAFLSTLCHKKKAESMFKVGLFGATNNLFLLRLLSTALGLYRRVDVRIVSEELDHSYRLE